MTHQVQIGNKSITLSPSPELLAGIATGFRVYANKNYTITNLATQKQPHPYEMIGRLYVGNTKDPDHMWLEYENTRVNKRDRWSKFLEDDNFEVGNPDLDKFQPIDFDDLKQYSLLLPQPDTHFKPGEKYEYGDYVQLYTFDTLEYLQGLISAIQWLGLDPRQLIFLLHKWETPLEYNL